MDDAFFKYAIIIVGVVIVTLLMAFAFTSLNKTLVVPEDEKQEFSGKAEDAKERVERLCDMCLTRATKFDCFIVNLEITDSDLQDADFSENVNLTRDLSKGLNIIKISYDDECLVRRLK